MSRSLAISIEETQTLILGSLSSSLFICRETSPSAKLLETVAALEIRELGDSVSEKLGTYRQIPQEVKINPCFGLMV